MTAQGGGEHVGGVQLVTARRLATPIVDGRRVEWFDLGAGKPGKVVLEGGLVDDDVDQRIERRNLAGRRSSIEDRGECIESSLPVGSLQQRGRHRITPPGDAGLPVGGELGIAEVGEDLFERGAGGDATARVDVHTLTHDTDVGIAAGVGSFVSVVGAVGVGEGLPSPSDDRELVVAQRHRMLQQQTRRRRQLLAAPWIGEHTRQQSQLPDAHGAGVRGDARFTDLVQQPSGLRDPLPLPRRSSCTSP